MAMQDFHSFCIHLYYNNIESGDNNQDDNNLFNANPRFYKVLKHRSSHQVITKYYFNHWDDLKNFLMGFSKNFVVRVATNMKTEQRMQTLQIEW